MQASLDEDIGAEVAEMRQGAICSVRRERIQRSIVSHLYSAVSITPYISHVSTNAVHQLLPYQRACPTRWYDCVELCETAPMTETTKEEGQWTDCLQEGGKHTGDCSWLKRGKSQCREQIVPPGTQIVPLSRRHWSMRGGEQIGEGRVGAALARG